MKFFKKLVWSFLRVLNLGGPVQLALKSGLKEDGWFRSYNVKQSVDRNGNPIPWITYPCKKFISKRLQPNFDLFEYGSGNSTLWFAKKVRTVTSMENDQKWFELIKSKMPENVTLEYKSLIYGGEYCQAINKTGNQYHVVIVDGRDRVNCMKNAVASLTADGVIILDNSELPQYKTGIEFMFNNGFRKIDFWGISPIAAHNTCTTIFYRTDNCLGI